MMSNDMTNGAERNGPMSNEIIEVGGCNWLVRQAKSAYHALNSIAMARCTGSVGSTEYENGVIIADVVRLNPDGTERQPS